MSTARKSVAMLLKGYIENDPKVARTLEGLNGVVNIFIYDLSHVNVNIPGARGRTKSIVVRMMYNIKVLCKLFSVRVDILHCVDYDTLGVGMFYARLSGAKVVYDCHEYFQDLLYLKRYGLWYRKYIAFMERRRISNVRAMIVVSDSIKREYEKITDSKIVTIRNIPKRTAFYDYRLRNDECFLKDVFDYSTSRPLFLYLGNTIERARGYETMKSICRQYSSSSVLLIVGKGMRERYGVQLKDDSDVCVRFYNEINVPIIEEVCERIYYGYSIIEPDCQSYYFALPNKMFDYLCYGVPVIASPIPEQSRLVEEYRAGVVLTGIDELDIKNIRNYERESMRHDLISEELKWESELEKLKIVYRDIL